MSGRRGVGGMAAGLVTVLLGASVLTAQEESAVLRGRVLADVTGQPVAGVQLRFDTGQRVLTDEEGRFRLVGLPLGEHRVALVTPSCQVTWGRVLVEARMSWETELTLPQTLAGFQPPVERRGGEGLWIAASDIEAMRVSTVADILRRETPEMVSAYAGQPGQAGRVRGRNRATLGGQTHPAILVDGVWTDAEVLWRIDAVDVAAIQVLEGASGGWMYGVSGGVVKVWTKRGGGSPSPGSPDACAVAEPVGGRG